MGHNSNSTMYKAPGIFHRGLDYWETDGSIAVAPSQDFYHCDFERKFSLNQHTLLQTEVTCSHVINAYR